MKKGNTWEPGSSETEHMHQQSRPSIKTATLSRVEAGLSPRGWSSTGQSTFRGLLDPQKNKK